MNFYRGGLNVCLHWCLRDLRKILGWTTETPHRGVGAPGRGGLIGESFRRRAYENLGVYELLRRRCKYIIAIDGEADTELGCGSLLQVIRFARIDMGIEIDIDLENLKLKSDNEPDYGAQPGNVEWDGSELKVSFNDLDKRKARLSNKHWALGTIDYGDQQGHLLYIKATMSNKITHNYIEAYKTRSSGFSRTNRQPISFLMRPNSRYIAS